jgi:cbb3-type cytochrome oxidase subunit 1
MAIVEREPEIEHSQWTTALHEWVTTVDHKKIGIMYVVMAIVFLIIGGAEAVAMRFQLLWPESQAVPPDVFNQLMTMHGTTMIFFVAMPILAGIANYVIPLQIGTRDMAFPRLNAFAFWVTLFGGALAYFSFATGGAPAIGWFAYSPLTEKTFSRGPATDFWILGLLVNGVGSLAGAVNIVTTVLSLRCPGMTLTKIPLYTWMAFWANMQILFAIPPLTAALVMVFLDRNLGAHFFDAQAGGSPYLWQHLFWFFGHPEVYILVLPAFGMISEVIPVFSRKVIFGYEFVAVSTVAIFFISFGVWAHHMFAVGMSRTADIFFAASSLVISVPTGIKMFNWLATLYGGKLRLAAPLLFCLGFLSMFVIDRHHAGHRARQLSAHRQLLRGRALSLGDHWRNADGALCGDSLLVSESHRPDVFRKTRAMAVLAVFDRVHPHLRTDARRRHAGDAPPDLHLPRRSGMGILESAFHPRGTRSGAELPDLYLEHAHFAEARGSGRRRPLGRLDARVGDDVAASRLQLCDDSHSQEPAATLGLETPR